MRFSFLVLAGLFLSLGIAACSSGGSGGSKPAPVEEPAAPMENAFAEGPQVFKETTSSQNGEWPAFLGTDASGRLKSKTAIEATKLGDEKSLAWKVSLGGGYSSVAIANGRAITMSYEKGHEIVAAFDAQTGEPLWKNGYPVNYSAHFGKGSIFVQRPDLKPDPKLGPRATPAIANGVVYTIGASGILLALSEKNGAILWKNDLFAMADKKIPPQSLLEGFNQKAGPPFGYCNSPLVLDGVVYVVPGGGNENSLAALDAETGKTLWLRHSFPYSYATPVAIDMHGKKQILFFTGAGPVSVDPKTGDVIWKEAFTSNENQNTAIPRVVENRVFLSAGYGKGGTLLEVAEDGKVSEVWKNKMATHYAPALYHEGFLYGFHDNILQCVDYATGAVKWSARGFTKGWVVEVDGKLLILGGNGKLAFAQPNSEKYEPIQQTTRFEENSPFFSAPSISDGMLYIRTETELFAIDLK